MRTRRPPRLAHPALVPLRLLPLTLTAVLFTGGYSQGRGLLRTTIISTLGLITFVGICVFCEWAFVHRAKRRSAPRAGQTD